MSTHIECCKIGVRLFATTLQASQRSKTLSLNDCSVSCDVHLTSETLIRYLRNLYDRLIVYAIDQSSVIFTVQPSKHVKYIPKSIAVSRKFETRLLREEKRNLIIDFFRHVIDEVMGRNLIWRTLRRFVFSFMCTDLVAREVLEYLETDISTLT